MRLHALAFTMLPFAAASCQLVFGVDEPPPAASGEGGEGLGSGASTGEGGAAMSSSSTGPAQCEVCLDPPGGWEGPVLRVAEPGKSEPLCPNAAIADRVYDGAPGQHECGACSCGSAAGGECGEATYHCWSGAECQGNALTTTNADDCLPVLFSAGTAGSCQVDAAPTPVGGSCPAVPGQVQGGGWMRTHGLCELTAAVEQTCADGTCFDTGGTSDADLCVYQEGAAECPAGWDTRYDTFRSELDDRSCECTCTPTNPACVGGGYAFGPVIGVCPTVVAPGQCRNDVNSGNKIDYTYSATCTPSAPAPGGSFQPMEPVTICCQGSGAG